MIKIVEWEGDKYKFTITEDGIIYIKRIVENNQLSLFLEPEKSEEFDKYNWDMAITFECLLFLLFKNRNENDDDED